MNISIDQSIRVFNSLKIDSPKKFKEKKDQFISMSKGSNGGPLYSSENSISVRDHYYSKWSDDDFCYVLKMIEDL